MKTSKFAATMQITAICTALLTLVFFCLYALWGQPVILSLTITFGTTFFHFIMRLIVGTLIPNRFSYRSRWFQPRRFETALYKKLRLKHWKGQMPTYNPKLFSLQDNSLEQIARNMCQAEVVHEVIILFSFIPLLFSRPLDAFVPFLVTSILAAGFDLLFVILQRFNRPRIIKMLELQTRRSAR